MSRPPATLAPPRHACFDRIARPYRWLEYLTFGRALRRCRDRLLPSLLEAREALVLGDGDGRFLAQLLDCNRRVTAVAVDSSGCMLRLLEDRCIRHLDRLAVRQNDALAAVSRLPAAPQFDLVVAHFFLDCLHAQQLEQLIPAVSARTHPQALWVISEFHIPTGWRRTPARAIVRSLYGIFKALTGLSVKHLPDHVGALERAGFLCIDRRHSRAGLLVSELWQKRP